MLLIFFSPLPGLMAMLVKSPREGNPLSFDLSVTFTLPTSSPPPVVKKQVME